MEDNYIELNRQAWNKKTAVHIDSKFYDMPAFMSGKNSLNEIELALLGDLTAKKILHLQCHFGQDTLSLARMGAQVTGVDLSDKAVEKARELSAELELDARFICCDLYNLPSHLDDTFDIVFTSYGTIGWLPDTDKWAALVSRYLKPGGQFVFAEFHPVMWMFDSKFTYIQYPYFNIERIVETEQGTYADNDADITNQTVSWNHSLEEVLTALMSNGLRLTGFQEYDYSPYNCFQDMEEFAKGKFRLKAVGNKLPMVYSITAIKE